MKADVYGSQADNWLFSAGIMREFGENKIITKNDGTGIFSVVEPLKCNPEECGLIVIGTIEVFNDKI